MSKLVVISLGQSDLGTGFPYVTAQIWSEESSRPMKLTGRLPSAREISILYKQWKELYIAFYERVRLRRSSIRIEQEDITNFSEEEFDRLCRDLEERINAWFESNEFRSIDKKIRSHLDLSEEVEIIIESDDDALQRVPWHLWNFFYDYRQAEIALSSAAYQRLEKLIPVISRTKLRILAILGDSTGIDIESDRRLLETFKDAETIFLVEPQRQELDQWLWDEQGWDILFFAGHSHTEVETGRMYINQGDSLTISQLSNALNKTIERGLQLAIFNSCDGLGIARQLSDLHIPQIVVMREPVPDRIAQEFLKKFLTAFSNGKSLHASVREARERLQGLENEFPCASWLPVICHNPAEEVLTWQELLERRLAQSQSPTRPYQGLFAFREEDAPLFFGREAYIEQLVKAVQQKSLVAAVGPSGSGKSSVVFAGLVPRIREIGKWRIIHCRPTDRPFQSLSEELIILLDPEIGRTERILRIRQLANGLKNKELTLVDILRDVLSTSYGQSLLLVIDQFEELYTLCRDIHERQAFLDQILAAVSEDLQFTVVLTLRADFYGQVLSSRPFSDALQGADIKLGPMNRQELQDVIVKPAENFGVQLEPGLTRRIIDEVVEEPGSLPLLEFALTQLWDKRNNDWMAHAAYNEIGGVKAALARYADEVYEQLSPEDQQQAQRIFIQLVRPGEGTEDTRRIATRAEVGEDNWDLVRRLADARLVVTGRAEKSTQDSLPEDGKTTKIESEETVEVIHEALIREWEQLRNWMNANRDFRSWQERLKFELHQWEATERDHGALLRGAPLATAEDWMQKRQSELNSLEKDYIQQSLDTQRREKTERERIQAERLRLQRRAIWGLTGGLAVSLLLAGLTGWQWIRAESQRRQAEINELEALAASSEASFNSGQRFDALLESLRAAVQLKKSPGVSEKTQREVTTRLQQALYATRERNRIEEHENRVNHVEVSPDGQTIASVGADGVINLWEQDGSLVRSYKSHDGSVASLSFNPTSADEFITVGNDGTIRLWNTSQSDPIAQWSDGEEYSGIGVMVGYRPDNDDDSIFTLIVSDVFKGSPAQKANIKTGDLILEVNGQSIRSINQERALEIIENEIKGKAGTQVELIVEREGEGKITITVERDDVRTNFNDVEFGPNGQVIATASDTGIRIWKRNGDQLNPFEKLQGRVRDIAFSPDGQLIATTGDDNTVKIWKLDGALVKSLDIGSQVLAVNFDPSGAALVTADADGFVEIWYRRGERYKRFWHGGRVQDVTFSPNGGMVAAVSSDKTIKIWSWDGTLLDTFKGPKNLISSVSFSPDGRFLVTGSHDRTVSLWNLKNPLVTYLEGHSSYVNGVAFSPDGPTIASVGADNTLKLWSSDGILQDSLNSQNVMYSVNFSPDGNTIASSGMVSEVKLWSADGAFQNNLGDAKNGHKDYVFDTAFSPDGNTIATASRDSTVKLWDQNGQLLNTLEDPSGEGYFATDVAFSPDEEILVIARGELAEIWDLNGNLISTLEDHVNSVLRVDFSPNSEMIATASFDGTAKIWSVDGTLLSTLEGHQGNVMDVDFSPDGQNIFTSSSDSTIKRWDLDGNLLGTFQGHNDDVQTSDISPDGKYLVSAGSDSQIILWDLQTSLDQMIQGACHLIGDFLEQNPNVSKSDRQLCSGVPQHFIAEGEEQARLGNLDEAVNLLETAKQNNLDLEFESEVKARQIRAISLLIEGERLGIQGKVRDAIDAFDEVEKIAPNFQITAGSWLLLCQKGSLHGYARDVLFACEKAVELGETGAYRDGLGLAMMLLGRTEEAIEEFQAFVDWWDEMRDFSPDQETFDSMTRRSQRRQRWIQTLKAGELVASDEIELLWREE